MTTPLDQHYTVPEVARLLHLSQGKVRAIFRGMPGVLELTQPRLTGWRVYRSIRIPLSVLLAWPSAAKHTGDKGDTE